MIISANIVVFQMKKENVSSFMLQIIKTKFLKNHVNGLSMIISNFLWRHQDNSIFI
jgi:hypothetical protein